MITFIGYEQGDYARRYALCHDGTVVRLSQDRCVESVFESVECLQSMNDERVRPLSIARYLGSFMTYVDSDPVVSLRRAVHRLLELVDCSSTVPSTLRLNAKVECLANGDYQLQVEAESEGEWCTIFSCDDYFDVHSARTWLNALTKSLRELDVIPELNLKVTDV